MCTRPSSATLILATMLGMACGGGGSKPGLTGPGGGALAIQVSGLPGGTSARVSVTGPTGGVVSLTGSEVLTDLAPGQYTVSAGYVNASNQTWTAQVSPGTTTVVEGDTADVAVAYAGGPPPSLNLHIAGTQLIQSTQRTDGSIPMIAGRDALLRVFVTATGGQQALPSVRVRIFAGGTQVDSVTVSAPVALVPTSVDTASIASSWNVLIPGARLTGGFGLQAVVDPGDEVAETDETDNVWPGPAPQGYTVQSVPAFPLRFVPVKQSVNNLTGRVTPTNKDSLAETTRRMHPLGATSVSVHSTYTTSAPALTSNDSNGGWSQILSEVYALRNADGFGGDYVGIVSTSYGSGIAGLGYVGAPAAVAWDKNGSAPGVIAHELGHNFGRSHAPCGNPSGPDPNYPYANASIGTWGLDLPALALKSPGTYKDLMSYCNPDWISDYNYLAIMAYRGSAAVRQAAADRGGATGGLLVWGRILEGTVVLEPAFRVVAPVRLPERPGASEVVGYDADGRRVFGVSFDGIPVADLGRGEEQHFAFVVPLAGSELDRLAMLRLTGKGLTARRSRAVPGAALRAPQAVASGTGELRWNPAYPLAVIRNSATGEILSLGRGGSVRLPAGAGPVTIELSEGVSSLPGVRLRAP